MVDETNWTTICPHCGYESEDSVMCRSCGRLMDESLPVRPFSASGLVCSIMTTWRSCLKNDDSSFSINEEPEFCPTWRSYPGNIYHGDEED